MSSGSGATPEAAALTTWLRGQLQAFLGYADDGAMSQHLLSFTNKQQLLEYCAEIMGRGNKVEQFAVELWKRKTAVGIGMGPAAGAGAAAAAPQEDLFARRSADTSSAALKAKHAHTGAAASSSSASSAQSVSAASSASSSSLAAVDLGLGRNVKVKVTSSGKGGAAAGQPSKPQRHLCTCQATTHPLYSSCTACGKIVCAAEGEGACFFCGSYVHQGGSFISDQFRAHMRERARRVPQNTEEMLLRADEAEESSQRAGAQDGSASASADAAGAGDDDGEEKKESSASSSASSAAAAAASLAKAQAQRDKLLSYAAAEKGTKIHDTDNDWYSFESDAFMTTEQRAAKKAEVEQALLNLDRHKAHTLTIDLAGKHVVAHSSDAWTESLDNAQRDAQPKWTDEAPATSDMAASSSSAPRTHGEAMAAAMGGSTQLRNAVEEMKIVSRKQYYANDTLTGRAREVYLSLKEALKPKPAAGAGAARNPNDRLAMAALPAPDAAAAASSGSSLLSSLAKSRAGESRIHSDEAEDDHDAAGDDAHLARRLKELELEAAPWRVGQREAASAAAAAAGSSSGASVPSCCASNDEDEPSCGAAPSGLDFAFTDAGDKGICLSMWQPWASLLVLGIKTLEGRGWYTPHRGRLWIASGSREVDPAEVAQVEDEYRAVYGPDAKIPFPETYPTSALLGCVDLTACWSAEELASMKAQSQLPGQEPILENSESAFVFVCRNARMLPVAQSISGAHKLWTLPAKLVQGLQPTLLPVASDKWKPHIQKSVSAKGAAPASKRAAGGVDLWPTRVRQTQTPALAAASAALQSSRPVVSALAPGVVLLRHALPLPVQQALLDACRQAAMASDPFAPVDASSASLSISLGLAWREELGRWEPRSDTGKPVQPIPPLAVEAVARVVAQAAEFLASHGAGARGAAAALPSYTPDLCELRYCAPGAAQDALRSFDHESEASRAKGFPVVLLCLGDTAELAYAPSAAAPASSRSRVTLASGDAMLWGGAAGTPTAGARDTATALERVQAQSKPKELFMTKGCLHLFFRKR